MEVAVIGAGISGLILANQLKKEHDVTVFEKSRGVGGRLATRYTESFEFDIGAQFFIARSQEFEEYLQPFLQAGVIDIWEPNFVEIDKNNIINSRPWKNDFKHYIGSPKMTSWAKYLAANITVIQQTKIKKMTRANHAWSLVSTDEETFTGFDWVVTAIPAEQATLILPESFYAFADIQQIKMTACFALSLGFSKFPDLPWQAALIKNNAISWISQNHSKPNRSKHPALVTLATNKFADEHIDADTNQIIATMQQALQPIIGDAIKNVIHTDLQRWRYANIKRHTGPLAFIDEQQQLACCGDWCQQGMVESAFFSAIELSRTLLKT